MQLRSCPRLTRHAAVPPSTPRPTRASVLAPRRAVTCALSPHQADTLSSRVRVALCGLGAAAAVLLGGGGAAVADGETRVGEFATSGLIPLNGIFRDTVQVVEVDDPEVSGVVLYFTDYSQSFVEKMANNALFSETSQASIACAATGDVVIRDRAALGGQEGKEVISERKTINLFSGKRIVVRRIYDEARRMLLYVVYSTRYDSGNSGRYKTSICAVPVTRVAAVAGAER
jgi:catabolite regulation protein CreA